MKNESTFKSVCPDFEEWPERWQIMPEDKKFGKELLNVFRPFCDVLIKSELTKKFIKNHLSYLWLLGGELIEIVNEDEKWRDSPALDLVMARPIAVILITKLKFDHLMPPAGSYTNFLLSVKARAMPLPMGTILRGIW